MEVVAVAMVGVMRCEVCKCVQVCVCECVCVNYAPVNAWVSVNMQKHSSYWVSVPGFSHF